MVTKLRVYFLLLSLAVPAAHAGEQPEAEVPAQRNHIYFHPIISALTASIPQLPLMVCVTYERNLSSPGNSFVWQPSLIVGEADAGEGITFTQFGTVQYLGLRHYFGKGYRGFYFQGSGAAAYSTVHAEKEGETDEVDGTVTAFGGLAFIGYKWSQVYVDAGAGYQSASGTLAFDSGKELDVSRSGLAIDINLGFGF